MPRKKNKKENIPEVANSKFGFGPSKPRYRVEHCGRYHDAYAHHCTECRKARGDAKRVRLNYDKFARWLNNGHRKGVRDDHYMDDDRAQFGASTDKLIALKMRRAVTLASRLRRSDTSPT